jgi:hypothetical protein
MVFIDPPDIDPADITLPSIEEICPALIEPPLIWLADIVLIEVD